MKNVLVESDSRQAIDLMQKSFVKSHPFATLIRSCKDLASEVIVFKHTCRESSHVADCLAKESLKNCLGWIVLDEPINLLYDFLGCDFAGHKYSRFL